MFNNRISGLAAGMLTLSSFLATVLPCQAQYQNQPAGRDQGQAQQGSGLQNQQGWPFAQPRGSSSYPWNSPGYSGYNEPTYVNQQIPQTVPQPTTFAQPVKYEMLANALPMKNDKVPTAVTLVAHVPENAQIWIGEKAMTATGSERLFQSPALSADDNYTYMVRVAWVEDGKVVSQTQKLPVKAGDVRCIHLVKAGSTIEGEKEAMEASLAKLTPEDRKAAETQKFCAVQNSVRLGAMGTPAKVTLNGEEVFLCCDACRDRAMSNAAATLTKAKELRTTAKAPASK